MTPCTKCRFCDTPLIEFMDLGQQCLQGQFPGLDKPDPPAYPLTVAFCSGCRLVQLGQDVESAEMFSRYWYRSSVSDTMKAHLAETVKVSKARLVRIDKKVSVLDIGGNDGTLLSNFRTADKTLIDPSDVKVEYPGITRITDFFPSENLGGKYDLIFAIACFYATPNPRRWLVAAQNLLKRNGLLVIEVNDLAMMADQVMFDAVVHEHRLYISHASMYAMASECLLKIIAIDRTDSNGGSLRYTLCHSGSDIYPTVEDGHGLSDSWTASWKRWDGIAGLTNCRKFAEDTQTKIRMIRTAVDRVPGVRHVLGASTKMAGILQAAKLTRRDIQAASDRDPRKRGLVMPGSRVPILTEEESRRLNPALYITSLPWREEILERERGNGKRSILFVNPEVELVTVS